MKTAPQWPDKKIVEQLSQLFHKSQLFRKSRAKTARKQLRQLFYTEAIRVTYYQASPARIRRGRISHEVGTISQNIHGCR
jgi:hypothetical protein